VSELDFKVSQRDYEGYYCTVFCDVTRLVVRQKFTDVAEDGIISNFRAEANSASRALLHTFQKVLLS
jgi:hypothetical protein